MKRLIILFLAALFALPAIAADYGFVYTTTPSNASAAITLQRDATAGRNAKLAGATLYCSVACTITFERDGTAATSSDATASVVKFAAWASGATPLVSVYTESNAGVGSVLGRYYVCAAGKLVSSSAACSGT